MFNINLEEAELELKNEETTEEDVLDYSKDINIFEALDSVQTTLDIMVCKCASDSIMEGSLILESKLLNTIINEAEESKEKKKGWFKKSIDVIVRFFKRIAELLTFGKWKSEEHKAKTTVKKAKKVAEAKEKEYLDDLDMFITSISKQATKWSSELRKVLFNAVNELEEDIKNDKASAEDIKKFNEIKDVIIKRIAMIDKIMTEFYRKAYKENIYIKQIKEGNVDGYRHDAAKINNILMYNDYSKYKEMGWSSIRILTQYFNKVNNDKNANIKDLDPD